MQIYVNVFFFFFVVAICDICECIIKWTLQLNFFLSYFWEVQYLRYYKMLEPSLYILWRSFILKFCVIYYVGYYFCTQNSSQFGMKIIKIALYTFFLMHLLYLFHVIVFAILPLFFWSFAMFLIVLACWCCFF